jgi:hypothetical protein
MEAGQLKNPNYKSLNVPTLLHKFIRVEAAEAETSLVEILERMKIAYVREKQQKQQ